MIINNIIIKWIDIELKSIIKRGKSSIIFNYGFFYPRSYRNSTLEPTANSIVKKILNLNEKILFLCFKYFGSYPVGLLANIIICYATLKLIKRL